MRSRLLALATALPVALLSFAQAPMAHAGGGAVWLVCNGSLTPCPPLPSGWTYQSSIQAAVDAAAAGDYILVWPGDYHESPAQQNGVLVTKDNIVIRGMNRQMVIVDGTLPSAAIPCSPSGADQNRGPLNGSGAAAGRNGIYIYQASGSWIENMTVCNFISDAGGNNGNQVWWDGGDGCGTPCLQAGTLGSYWGDYISATSTYFPTYTQIVNGDQAQGKYGLFVSTSDGGYNGGNGGGDELGGFLEHDYASNQGDSSFYIGACDDCHAIMNDDHAQYSSIGYSGTNSGGNLLIENSDFSFNKTGVVPNSLNNPDAPAPQDGACPNSTPDAFEALRAGGYCTFFTHNTIHDNNDANVAAVGISAETPVGTGVELVGTKHDTVQGNYIYNNGAWGVVVHDFPDTEQPPSSNDCYGGIPGPLLSRVGQPGLPVCYFQGQGNRVLDNTMWNNGGFGNPSNSDLALQATGLSNCFDGNSDTAGALTSDPPAIQTVDASCDGPTAGETPMLTAQLVCASDLVSLTLGPQPGPGGQNQFYGQCPSVPGASNYPRQNCDNGEDCVYPLPTSSEIVPSEADPCTQDPAPPANPWCDAIAAGTLTVPSGPAPYIGPPAGTANFPVGASPVVSAVRALPHAPRAAPAARRTPPNVSGRMRSF